MKSLSIAVCLFLTFALSCGVIFPLCVWGFAQILFPFQANGSFLTDNSGKQLGSVIIGQKFTSTGYFHARPSAAGAGYDAKSSGGSNLGPLNEKLIHGLFDKTDSRETNESFTGIQAYAAQYRLVNHISTESPLPADAVTSSGSGLDPDISLGNAFLQAPRIAEARKRSISEINKLIEKHAQGRTFGLFGEPRVNVLLLNLELDGRLN